MNRIVLIGNGFDLAHGLKTSYADFINWYKKKIVEILRNKDSDTLDEKLCTFRVLSNGTWYDFFFNNDIQFEKNDFLKLFDSYPNKVESTYSTFFTQILNHVSKKGWVDIENEYYRFLTKSAIEEHSIQKMVELNAQMNTLKDNLIEYLNIVANQTTAIEGIRKLIFSPIITNDISVSAKEILKENVDSWMEQDAAFVNAKIQRYGLKVTDYTNMIEEFRRNYQTGRYRFIDVPWVYLLPDAITLLNFNYTNTAQIYQDEDNGLGFMNYIHGTVDDPQSVIFGYGDELDDKFKQLQNLNENECLNNIKSIKYLEADNYRRILAFMEAEPYQVCIMGHSCGNSDRTLLNTLFEHKNCISIKPYYYQKEDGTDNYMEIVQNISRNFTDMKLMRDRVVNKTQCEALPQIKRK